MKENLKKVGGYIADVTKVCLLAPIVLTKIMTDSVLLLLLVIFHALYGEKEKSASLMNEVINKMD